MGGATVTEPTARRMPAPPATATHQADGLRLDETPVCACRLDRTPICACKSGPLGTGPPPVHATIAPPFPTDKASRPSNCAFVSPFCEQPCLVIQTCMHRWGPRPAAVVSACTGRGLVQRLAHAAARARCHVRTGICECSKVCRGLCLMTSPVHSAVLPFPRYPQAVTLRC